MIKDNISKYSSLLERAKYLINVTEKPSVCWTREDRIGECDIFVGTTEMTEQSSDKVIDLLSYQR